MLFRCPSAISKGELSTPWWLLSSQASPHLCSQSEHSSLWSSVCALGHIVCIKEPKTDITEAVVSLITYGNIGQTYINFSPGFYCISWKSTLAFLLHDQELRMPHPCNEVVSFYESLSVTVPPFYPVFPKGNPNAADLWVVTFNILGSCCDPHQQSFLPRTLQLTIAMDWAWKTRETVSILNLLLKDRSNKSLIVMVGFISEDLFFN